MRSLYGLYPDARSARLAFERLRAVGLEDREITVISPQPIEGWEDDSTPPTRRLWWLASFGGLLGMSGALGLLTVIQTSWPINVGSLPTFAWWPNLIVVFELTMLGAIACTVISFVVSSGLGRGRLYDPEVSSGKILVGVEKPPPNRVGDLETALALPSIEVRRS